ncbi:O-acyltransferase like protein [Parasteatoda tepidariorum]|uniref:O-acyltransferase like protein n=1 Tax=Parasteatoda tepidariorum TaxID=114398 RepID=UPI001C72305D|nr:nose resistant to fluoxetine protein 6-like [Parasteatoda tepidariorum]
MNKNIYSCFVFLFVALTCTEAKEPRMYAFPRSKHFDRVNWKDFMVKANWASSELIKISTPYVVENYPTGNVSEVCTKSLLTYVDGIKNWRRWAIRMFDVTGKIPNSFKRGAGIEFGSYDDCLRIAGPSNEVPPFSGQFCMVHLQTSRPFLLEEDTPFKRYATNLVPSLDNTKRILNWHLGICIPSSCSEQDIYNIITALTKAKFENVTASVSNCESKITKQWTESTEFAVLVLKCLLGLCIIGTLLDVMDQEPAEAERLNTGIIRQSLKAFSIRSNTIKLFDRARVDVEIRRICGVLSVVSIWIIVCNTIVYRTPWKEMRYTSFRDISMAVGFADSFVVAMDAIFFICGFLSIFLFWNICEKTGGITGVFKGLLKIYFKLTAINAFTILASFALALIYYGPLWNQTWNDELMRCRNNGWLNLFNAQTLLPIDETCWMHTWYPALLVQCSIASIPLMFLLYRYPKIGFTVGVLVLAVILGTENAISSRMLDSLHYFELIRVTIAKYYSKPLFYFLPYLLGILAGRITIRFKDQQLSKVLHVVGWILSIVICVNVLSDGNFSKLSIEQSPFDLAKRTFLLCIAFFWIMYASVAEGVVGRILSSGALSPFTKVCYNAYMIHILLIIIREAALKERIYIGKLVLTIESTSHTFISFILGMFIHVIVELPIARLCEIYMDRNEKEKLKAGTEHSEANIENSKMDEKKDS